MSDMGDKAVLRTFVWVSESRTLNLSGFQLLHWCTELFVSIIDLSSSKRTAYA